MKGQYQDWLLAARRCFGLQSSQHIRDGDHPPRVEQEVPSGPPPNYENLAPLPPNYGLHYRGTAQESKIDEGVDTRMSEMRPYLEQLLDDPNVIEAVSAIIREGCINVAKAITNCNVGEYTKSDLDNIKKGSVKAKNAVMLAWEAAASVGKPLGAAIVAANAITATAYESANARDVSRRNAAFFASCVHRKVCDISYGGGLDMYDSH
jgi:hypothetical protein